MWEARVADPTPTNVGKPCPLDGVASLSDPVILNPAWALWGVGLGKLGDGSGTYLWQSCQIHAWRPFLGRKSDWPLLWIWEEKRSSRR